MNTRNIYNLIFPSYINELNIGGYKFSRVKDYRDVVLKMTHVVLSGEISLPNGHQLGTHQITATVEIPNKEEKSVLEWGPGSNTTKLNDILLLLTLFTEHNVFTCDDNVVPLSVDPRCHHEGGGPGEFRSFIKHNYKFKETSTGNIFDDFPPKQQKSNFRQIDLGFEETINFVLEFISSEQWQKTFNKGHFLFLFKEMMDQVYITTKFIMCWTILEHIFALHNSQWLSDSEIHKMSGESKLSFIYQKYIPNYFQNKKNEELKKINITRNRLIHYGKIPDNIDIKEVKTFVIITQIIVAKILGLKTLNN